MTGFSLPLAGSLATDAEALRVTVSAGGGAAIVGQTYGPDGTGRGGQAVTGETDIGIGVYGRATNGGVAVQGEAREGVGTTGVLAFSTSGRGVVGRSTDTDGVMGTSVNGTGVVGEGAQAGVHGKSAAGHGVYGEQTGEGDGVHGVSSTGTGVAGLSGTGVGVYAVSSAGRGVEGRSTDADGVMGVSEKGVGVFGEGADAGVHGKSDLGYAVYGEQTGDGDGVHGLGAAGTGVAGLSGTGSGVYGHSDSGHAGYFEGDVRVTGNVHCDKDIYLTNADCAEEWDLAPAQRAIPGSVMVLDDDGRLEACASAYDSRVVGILSGAGRFRPAVVLDRQAGIPDRANLAVLGKVHCLADAAHGPISVGDLLTTSPTPAHAMRSTDRARSFGSVIGKALGPLSVGSGLIPVLVALQ